MSTIRTRLIEALADQLSQDSKAIESWLTSPKRPEHGDVSLPCFPLMKTEKAASWGKNPAQVASTLADSMVLPMGIAEAVAAGPFLNFRFDRGIYAEEVVGRILAQGAEVGKSDEGEGRPILVDYSSPNIAKPFHVGHIRSTLIGNSLCRIFRFLGHPVTGINHLGDWGTQFGLVFVGCQEWGRPPEDHPDPVQALVEVYQKASRAAKEDSSIEERARDWFRSLEAGDPDAQAFWEYAREVSLDEFKRIYARLGVEFDSFKGESFYNDKMAPILEEIKDKNLGEVSDGSFGVQLGDKLGFAMLQKADGATLYLTRDLAAVQYRWDEYTFEKVLYTVGNPQSLHFLQLTEVLNRMGRPFADRIKHVAFGHVEGMSTRSGGAIPLVEFLDEGHRRALQAFREEVRVRPEGLDENEIAEKVSLSAIIFNDLSRGRIKDVKFDWDHALSFRGDTGPYLQYAHARIHGIEGKAGVSVPDKVDGSLLVEDVAHRLLGELDRFTSVVRRAAQEFEPSIIAQYLLDLARAFSSANDVLRVKGEETALAQSRLALFVACRSVLAAGLRLLGINPVNRM